MNKGAQVRIPRLFLWVLKYVTPLYLLVLFVVWFIQQGPSVLTMAGIAPEHIPWRWVARGLLIAFAGALIWAVYKSPALREKKINKP
jgi:hypothetical protein